MKTLEVLKLFLALALVLAAVAIAQSTEPPQCTLPGWNTRTETVTTYRAARGHTHTCTSCGRSWDHAANPTHTCKNCGGHPPIARGGGYLADPIPRPIKVTTTKTIVADAYVPATPAPQAAWQQVPPVFAFPTSSGCANGQCSTIARKFR